MFMVASDYKVQDHLEGTIRLQRGQLCQQQEGGAHRSGRGDYLWVKVREFIWHYQLEIHLWC